MTSIRWALIGPEHQRDLDRLYSLCFPVPAGASFLDDFPIWTPGLSPQVVQWGAWWGTRMVASASIRFGTLKSHGSSIGIIGGVVTDPEFKGKGYASQGISKLLLECEKRDISLIFLWGMKSPLYQRFGFELCGVQCRASLFSLAPVFDKLPASNLMVVDGWDPRFFDLIHARPQGLSYAQGDIRWVERHKNIRWIGVYGDDRKPCAYLALGRGIDLPGMVHDWGGTEAGMLAALAYLNRENPGIQILYHPILASDFPFLAKIKNPTIEHLCMAKPLREKIDFDKIWFYGLDSC